MPGIEGWILVKGEGLEPERDDVDWHDRQSSTRVMVIRRRTTAPHLHPGSASSDINE
jgi:hypothetical protein